MSLVNRLKLRLILIFALMIPGLQVLTPQTARAAGGNISGTITINGQIPPSGTFYVAALRYVTGCSGIPIGLAIVDLNDENGSFSIDVPENAGYKILFKPLSNAPRTAVQRWYTSNSVGGTDTVLSAGTCINISNSNATNINLATTTTSESVVMSGSVVSFVGEPITSADVLVSKTISSMYFFSTKGYAAGLSRDGKWEIAGIDPNQTVYIQVHVPRATTSYYCAIKGDGDWTLEAASPQPPFNCPASAAVQLGTSDIGDINIRLPKLGTISGTISGPTGPVGHREVCASAFRTDSNPNNTMASRTSTSCTDESGHYELNVPYGNTTSYKLEFAASGQSGLRSEWHQDVSIADGYAAATPIVMSNSTPIIVNPTLESLKYITGRVSSRTGSAVASVYVTAVRRHPIYDFPMAVSSAITDSEGNYKVFIPEDGQYTVAASHNNYSYTYLGDSETFEGATFFTIGAGDSFASSKSIVLDQGLSLGGALSTSDDETATACVSAFKVDPEFPQSWGEWVTGACFSSPGRWKLNGLRPGKYRLRQNNGSGYREGFIGGSTASEATEFTLLNSSRTDIDIALNRGKSIRGKIRGASGAGESGICVTAGQLMDNGGTEWSRWNCTNSVGEYSISGLTSGRYVLQVQPPSASDYYRGFATANGLVTDQQSEAQILDLRESNDIAIAADQILTTAPKLTGTVKDGVDGIGGVCLSAYLTTDAYSTGRWISSGCSSSTGSFSISGLTPGTYRVRVEPRTGSFRPGWYRSGSPTTSLLSDATSVTVKTGESSKSLGDVALAVGTSISGVLWSSGAQLPGTCVTALLSSNGYPTEYAGQGCSNQSGRFTVIGLNPGESYLLRVETFGGRYRAGFINDSGLVVSGFDGITPRTPTSNLDVGAIEVGVAPTISGVVTSGNQSAEPNVCVTAHDEITLNWVTTSCTNSTGKYALRGLNENGRYRLSWWSSRPLIAPGWFSSTVETNNSADAEVVIISGSSDAIVNIRVANAGSITGRISTPGLCIAAWTVSRSDFDSQLGDRDNASAISCSNNKGEFTLKGLKPSIDYYLQAFSPVGNPVIQTSPWDDSAVRTGASSVSVVAS